MLKHYANLVTGQTHYRQAGEGIPVLALHPSPLSSASLTPMMDVVSDEVKVIAPDTPGYGQSDQLPKVMLESSADLAPYSDWLVHLLNYFGFKKIGLYGAATGAQIALDFAIRHPERLRFVVMDAAAHFSEQERSEIPAHYFPAITPKVDGSHLQTIWKMSSGLFKWFPWYAQNSEHQISDAEPDPEIVHLVAKGYLNAGPDYAEAYTRAFQAEDAERIKLVTSTPLHIVRWQGSIVKQYADRFDQFDFAKNVTMHRCGPELVDRYRMIKKIIVESE